MSTAKITRFGLQSGTTDTLYATWEWSKSHTENYQVRWCYDTGNSFWFVGNYSNTEYNFCTYNFPSNAKRVRFMVRPISRTYTNNGKSYSYWTAQWSTAKIFYVKNLPPDVPSPPSVSVDRYKLIAKLDNLPTGVSRIQFQVVKDDKSIASSGYSTVSTGHTTYSCTLLSGSSYKVRCRAVNQNGIYSEWSEYSEAVYTVPNMTNSVHCTAISETSVYVTWVSVSSATSYDIEYTTKREYFDISDQTSVISGIEHNNYHIVGLESGQEYFFRVRAVNEQGSSAWTTAKSVVIGTEPAAPTTWSSTTTCIVGDSLTLYWMHNSEDGSSQTYAEVELYINGIKETHTVNSTNEYDDKKTTHYSVDTSEFSEGSKIQWRVRTAGVTKKYSEWSIQRSIDIYAPPTLELSVTDVDGEQLESLKSFPFYILGVAEASLQTPIGYFVTISAKESYETADDVGNKKMISAGEAVYSKNFDISEKLLLEMSAGNIDLENNISYTVECTVSMDSGLTAEASADFTVAWTDELYEPNAEINIDYDAVTASIRPYCTDENDELIDGIVLSVYRREYDGNFTKLASNISNTDNIFITDPHPSLDYARYRIVAVTSATGAVSYYDVPGCLIGEKALVIQWDEAWSNFDISNEDTREQPTWAGSMLKLPYNVDVSSSYSPDYSIVEYIGRKYPVSYYGTQLGETASWSVEIDKNDKDTLYALRRLSVWQGDAYVREPSGSGYWANVGVSFSQTHCEVTIPVSLKITRVEGGE